MNKKTSPPRRWHYLAILIVLPALCAGCGEKSHQCCSTPAKQTPVSPPLQTSPEVEDAKSMVGQSLLDKPAPEFRLMDPEGREHALADFQDAQLVVVAFLGTECPLAKLYGPRLNRLANEYAPKGVRFIGIDANVQDTPEKITVFAREHRITFPLVKDPGNKIADRFGAVRTPEVYLLDKQRIVRYHGRIDDQYRVGLKKPQLGRRDLAEAIDELLAGKEVTRPELSSPGCFIGRAVKPTASVEVTYSKHIAPIMHQHCMRCHRKDEIAPFPLTSYREVVGWGETIREVVGQGRMPPWFADPKHGTFVSDARLSDNEKQQIVRWVEAGCPEGDPKDLPEPPHFAEGWNIPEPHLVLKINEKPFRVPAEGSLSYKHFVVDPKFTEDKWVVACEVRPQNRSVVHHVLVFLKRPGEPPDLLRGSLLASYAPGSPARKLRSDRAWAWAVKIPAGSKIIFQVHYTPNGTEQEETSILGLVFRDAKDVRQELTSGWAENFFFAIPPDANNHRLESKYRFSEDRMLVAMTPHMHVRGKSFRYEAVYPDGRREILLDVPKYDFNWQLDYELAEPKLMPKGTVLHCTAHYDNSADNLANPNPKKWVTFGEQTWDEMMLGWFMSASMPREAEEGAGR